MAKHVNWGHVKNLVLASLVTNIALAIEKGIRKIKDFIQGIQQNLRAVDEHLTNVQNVLINNTLSNVFEEVEHDK
jgi:hypothetical protein